jgi:hypothetical protein
MVNAAYYGFYPNKCQLLPISTIVFVGFCSVPTFNRLDIVDEKPICNYCTVAYWH